LYLLCFCASNSSSSFTTELPPERSVRNSVAQMAAVSGVGEAAKDTVLEDPASFLGSTFDVLEGKFSALLPRSSQ